MKQSNIQYINPTKLFAHPHNQYYFDDIQGDKWDDFLKSIKTSGIIEPIVVTQKMIVVSGHQRVRAAQALKLKAVPVVVKEYKDDDEVLKELLETNLRQRGTISTSNFKSANIAKTLERIYKTDDSDDNPKTQKELADKLGISLRSLQYLKTLDKLSDDLKELIEEKKISSTTAIKVFEKLNAEERAEVIKMLQQEQSKTTNNTINDYIEQIRNKDLEISKLKNEIVKIGNTNNNNKKMLFDDFIKSTSDYKKKIQSILKNAAFEEILQSNKTNENEISELQKTVLSIIDVLSEISENLGEVLFEF